MTSHAETLEKCLPAEVIGAIVRLTTAQISGQLIMNFNRGDVQSYEVKEHRRIHPVRLRIPD